MKYKSFKIAPAVKILNVDDIKTNLKVFEGFIKPYKINVTSCLNGFDAIEKCKNDTFDMIFLDYLMPHMSGKETLKELKSLINDYPYLKRIPYICLSANNISGADRMFQDSGFSDYLFKPINADDLEKILVKWIPEDRWFTEVVHPVINENIIDTNKIPEFSINGINIKEGLKISGKLKDYLNLLKVFYDDGQNKIKEINSSFKNNDISKYTIYVHALKSASSNIGANDLALCSKALEDAGNRNDIDYIKTNTDKLLSDLEILMADINTFLKKNKELSFSGANFVRTVDSVYAADFVRTVDSAYAANKDRIMDSAYVADNDRLSDKNDLKNKLMLLKTGINEFDSSITSEATSDLRLFANADTEIGKTIEKILLMVLYGDDDEALTLIDSILIL